MLIVEVAKDVSQIMREFGAFLWQPRLLILEGRILSNNSLQPWKVLLWAFSFSALFSNVLTLTAGPDLIQAIKGSTPIETDFFINGKPAWPDKDRPIFASIEWLTSFNVGYFSRESVVTKIRPDGTVPPVLIDFREDIAFKEYPGTLPAIPTIRHQKKYHIKRAEFDPADMNRGDVRILFNAVGFANGFTTLYFDNMYWEKMNGAVMLLVLNVYVLCAALNVYLPFKIVRSHRSARDTIRFCYVLGSFILIYFSIFNLLATVLVKPSLLSPEAHVSVLTGFVLLVSVLPLVRSMLVSLASFFETGIGGTALAVVIGLPVNAFVVPVVFIPACFVLVRFYVWLGLFL